MSDKPKKLSDTARALLIAAASRPDHLIALPRLPVAAARQVVRSLLQMGLAEEVPAPVEDAACFWRTDEARVAEDQDVHTVSHPNDAPAEAAITKAPRTQAPTVAKVNKQALHAMDSPTTVFATAQDAQEWLGAETCEVTAPSSPPPPKAHRAPRQGGKRREQQGWDSLRQATQALLDAWDALITGNYTTVDSLISPIAGLRAALTTEASICASISGSRPRKETKHAQVLTMLRRNEGASGLQIAEAMRWAPHTVRGFLANLAKKGITVEVLDRVRQVGPDKAGAKGSYTIYRLGAGTQQ
jgi:hypothetical protein